MPVIKSESAQHIDEKVEHVTRYQSGSTSSTANDQARLSLAMTTDGDRTNVQDARKTFETGKETCYRPNLSSADDQIEVVTKYDRHFQNDTSVHHEYDYLKEEQIAAIVENSGKMVDFITTLPYEISEEIISYLSPASKYICLTVCKTWCKILVECTATWIIAEGIHISESQLMEAVPHIASRVQELTISTKSQRVWNECLLNMNNSCFASIRSLYLSEFTTNHINNPSVVTAALGMMNSTLTKIEVAFDVIQGDIIPVGDIVFACTNLRTLIYRTTSTSTSIIGEHLPLQPHYALIDIHLEGSNITGESIEPILRQCQQIRRLVINGCFSSVLDIVDANCPNIEVFAYNQRGFDVPELPDIKRATLGLRALFTVTERELGDRAPANKILPLLRKHMKTLEMVCSNFSGSGIRLDGVMYEDLKLENLKHLAYVATAHDATEEVILRALSNCTHLTSFIASLTKHVSMIANALIAIPPVKNLYLAYATDNEPSSTESLMKLFRAYGVSQKLENISLVHCPCVTDDVLVVLAGIQSLRNVALGGLTISGAGIELFLRNLGNHVTEIELGTIACVTDDHIAVIGKIKSLVLVSLEGLEKVTDHGISGMVDTTSTITSLSIARCPSISQAAIDYAMHKVQKVVYEI